MSAWLDNIMSPLNAAGQGIEKLIEVRDLVKFGDDFRKLHTEILAAQRGAITAQASEAALLEQVSALKKKVTDLEAWSSEKQRYQLVALAPNVLAYAVKADARGVEPPHCICANCYNNGKKSYLNQYVQGSRLDKFRCNTCKDDLIISKSEGASPTSYRAAPHDYGPDGWMVR